MSLQDILSLYKNAKLKATHTHFHNIIIMASCGKTVLEVVALRGVFTLWLCNLYDKVFDTQVSNFKVSNFRVSNFRVSNFRVSNFRVSNFTVVHLWSMVFYAKKKLVRKEVIWCKNQVCRVKDREL